MVTLTRAHEYDGHGNRPNWANRYGEPPYYWIEYSGVAQILIGADRLAQLHTASGAVLAKVVKERAT